MSQNIQVAYSLLGGYATNLNVQFGINANPTTVTVDVVAESGQTLNIKTREFVSLKIGAFDFKGIVQSWDKSEIDLAGTGVYQVRLTDTKPVLEAAQVIIGSPFKERSSSIPFDYGKNIITITPSNSTQITDGINFSRIKQFIQSVTLKYGIQDYTVSLDFTLASRGPNIEYSIENSVLSLSELISRIADDHGLDWYVDTSIVSTLIKIISVKFFDRTKNIGTTFDLLKSLHSGEIIKFHQGKENRDSVIKSVLIGGYKSYLHEVQGSFWKPFWGFKKNPEKPISILDKCKLIFEEENTNIPNTGPDFSIPLMEKIINKKYDPKEFTEEEIQRVISYANEFWGRRFYTKITPAAAIDASGLPWVIPTSAGWWESDDPPACFDHNGQLKFETDDGRWVTFIQIPLPGIRNAQNISYQWDDTLFSNPNTHVGPEPNTNILHGRTVWIKATLEVFGSYFVLTLSAPLRIKKITTIPGKPGTPAIPGISGTPGRLPVAAVPATPAAQTVEETRMDFLEKTWLALLDQRVTYGPWSNQLTSIGKTEVVIDNSLVPWNFGYHGITNSQGIEDMTKAANARIRSIVDTTSEVDSMELQVANVPKINIGTQLNKTGALTSISVNLSVNGITTTYKSNQFGKNQNVPRRKPPGKQKPFKEFDFNQKAIPEPTIDSPKESRDVQQPEENLLGQIIELSNTLTDEPRYNINPVIWANVNGRPTIINDSSRFGDWLNVDNIGEPRGFQGRLSPGTIVNVIKTNSVTVPLPGFPNETGLAFTTYTINVSGPTPQGFVGVIDKKFSTSQPTYAIKFILGPGQTGYDISKALFLTETEVIALDAVLNIGEPQNYGGNIPAGTQVSIRWNKRLDGSFFPYFEQQLNLFKPV